MSYFPQKDKHVVSAGNSTTTPLGIDATFTGTAELNDYSDVMVQAATDQDGTIWYDFSMDGTNWDTTLPFLYRVGQINAPHVLVKGYRYFRVRFVNTSGIAQTYLRLYTFYGELNKLTAPTNGLLAQTYDALPVRPTDYSVEVALGKRQGVIPVTKFGGINGISANTTQTIWSGDGEYTGFDSDVAANIRVVSDDVNDAGALVTSGTATGGDNSHIEDSAATFISDGVAAGDIFINDTDGAHAIVKSVDSETSVTLFNQFNNLTWSGKAYRVATANNTGAAVVKLQYLIDEDFQFAGSEYIILNGTNFVATTGTYIRCHRAAVVLSGTTRPPNEGNIIGYNASDANIVYVHIAPDEGQTLQCTFTVPDDYVGVLKRFYSSIARDGAQAASADVRLKTRRRGEPWRTEKYYEITTSSPINYSQDSPLTFEEYTDVKIEIADASATLSTTGEMEGFLVFDK